MSRKIKLIWDFYGEDALPTAKHHVIHLKEFAQKENIELFDCGTESLENDSSIAYMTVAETNMIVIRDTLRPKRGQWVEQ